MSNTKPSKVYAVVLADGTTEEFKTKGQAVARGEHSGQAFTVLSPRGYEVHVQEAPVAEEPPTATVVAEEMPEGVVAVGTLKKDPVRKIARLTIGKKWVSAYDGEGRCFLYVPIGSEVSIVVE